MRLSHMDAGEQFRFICSADQADRLVRVIACRNGQVLQQRQEIEGIVFTVCKQPD